MPTFYWRILTCYSNDMELKPFSESDKTINLDGHTVRYRSSSEHGIRDQVIAVDTRRPLNGLLVNTDDGVRMVRVLNQRGHLFTYTSEGRTEDRPICHGDVALIPPNARYAIEGPVLIAETQLPSMSQDTAEYVEYIEEH
jgi:hypothetical protein